MPPALKLDDITMPLVGIVEHEAHPLDRQPEIVSAEAEQMHVPTGLDPDPDKLAVHFRDRRLVHVLDTHLHPEDSNSRMAVSGSGVNENLLGAEHFC